MTGARRGEIAGLRWVDIDLNGARITIRQALLASGGEVYVSSPKSYRGRTVNIHWGTVEQLEAHRDRQIMEKAACYGEWEESGYVFVEPDGSALNPRTLTQTFRWIVDESDLPRIRLHDLRHTHASIAVKAGVPIGVVSERLGHASPEFTLHRYAHVMPGMQREAADKIASAVRFDGLAAWKAASSHRVGNTASNMHSLSLWARELETQERNRAADPPQISM